MIVIDYDNNLWKYYGGTWSWIRSGVKSATINDIDEIYVVDDDNLVFRIKE